jgi:hypothetical protein
MNNDQRNFEQFMKQRDEVARAYVNGEVFHSISLLSSKSFVAPFFSYL